MGVKITYSQQFRSKPQKNIESPEKGLSKFCYNSLGFVYIFIEKTSLQALLYNEPVHIIRGKHAPDCLGGGAREICRRIHNLTHDSSQNISIWNSRRTGPADFGRQTLIF